ncbi:MAG: hypothetical protein K2J59_06440 [Eubacterium sp.]|nr:hypothetical protein [Eubacterium sp.]
MNDRIKEIILKIVIALSGFFLILFIVLTFSSSFLCPLLCEDIPYDDTYKPFPEPFNSYWLASLLLFAFFAILMIILMNTFKFDGKPIKPDKFPLGFNDFCLLERFFIESLSSGKYIQQPEVPFEPNGKTVVFIRPGGSWKIDCVALIRVKELNDEILNNANDSITEALYNYYGKREITDTVSMISVICVDRITPAFQKLMNSNVKQGFKNFRLPVGISFGGKQIYIANQKDGFAIAKYKKLRKEFMKIMNLTKEQRIKPNNSHKKIKKG